MILEEELPNSELMFSVPKAILFCPSAAVHVGHWGCRGASSRDRGCSLTGNLMSELSGKNSLCFIRDDCKHCSLDFPFQEQYEKRNSYFLLQKSSSLHCLWPSQVPALLPFTEFCFSAFTLVVTSGTSLAGVTQVLHQALSGEAEQNTNGLLAEVTPPRHSSVTPRPESLHKHQRCKWFNITCHQTLYALQFMLGISIKETLEHSKEELWILIMFSIFSSKVIENEGWSEIIEHESCVLCQISSNTQVRGDHG